MSNRSGRKAYQPARVRFEDGRLVASPIASRGSADIVAHAQANALVILDADRLLAQPGERAPAHLLGTFLEKDASD